MKKIIGTIAAIVILLAYITVPCSASAVNFSLEGAWLTSDGVRLTFHNDGYYELEWGYFPTEAGRWYGDPASGSPFEIEMDGSNVMNLMSMVYGTINSNYHFEVLVCNQDNFYLVQVYGDYSARTSPCKLGFTREGAEADFTLPETDYYVRTVHSTQSPEDAYSFSFRENEELEDLIFELGSDQYHPRLAHFLSVMADAVYDKKIIKENYETLKLDFYSYHYDEKGGDDMLAGYIIGSRQLTDGTKLVMITIRGTFDNPVTGEWGATDFNGLLDINSGNFLNMPTLTDSQGRHDGFSRCTKAILEDLERYLDGKIETSNTTYVITGHSLGAAAGNLLAYQLFEAGVSPEHVYDYNFACPNTAVGKADVSVWNKGGIHNNIINVGNWCDLVTHAPTNDWFNFSDQRWKRYGQSYWFSTGYGGAILRTVDQNAFDAHEMRTYLSYLRNEYPQSRFLDSEYVVDAVSARCPVDVTIYNSNGEPVAGAVDGVAEYFDAAPGENALITINGDEKLFWLFPEDQYEVRLEATDKGEMTFSYGRLDLLGGVIKEQKSFDSVGLKDGKTMKAIIGSDIETDDVSLYVTNKDNEPVAEIQPDGVEKQTSGRHRNDREEEPQRKKNQKKTNRRREKANANSKWIWLVIVLVVLVVFIIVVAVICVVLWNRRDSNY